MSSSLTISPPMYTPSILLGKRKGGPEVVDCDDRIKARKLQNSNWSSAESVVDENTDAHFIIANSPRLQSIFQEKQISYGVQWEIARLLTLELEHVKCEDIQGNDLDALMGSNEKAAPQTIKVLLKATSAIDVSKDPALTQELAARSPWRELDIEDQALSGNAYGGIGNNPDYPNWYGGKVEFRAKLKKVGSKTYKIALERCTLGPSSRFTRRFGSWSFLRIKIPLNIFHDINNGLESFFRRPFVLWDRVFRACYAKDNNVFLFRTNEVPIYNQISTEVGTGMSLEEFIDWHNPLATNVNQSMTKWSARTALGFSNSVPGPLVAQENIGEEEDYNPYGTSDMTDGCGFNNLAVSMEIFRRFKLEIPPALIQFRFRGEKGTSLTHFDMDNSDGKLRMSFRPSQTKIRYPSDQILDPAKLTIDILRTSYMRVSTHLSPEIIINLAENEVPHSVMIELLVKDMRKMVEGLTTWDGPDAMFKLWSNVELVGGVLSARRARESAGESRFRGYGRRADEVEEEDDDDGLEDVSTTGVERSTAWWADYTSGCPSALEETVMVLLDSGFTPQKSPILRDKLKKVVTTKLENRARKMHFEVEQSVFAFVVPDPYHILGPNEIQFKSSNRNLKSLDGYETDVIVGDVLMTRNPCKLPTDVRKIKAVEHPILRQFVDVIVCSVQGERRLLDYLAGGDYDGDTCTVIWDPAIVNPFQNADEKHSLEPNGLDYCFDRETEAVADFIAKSKSMSSNERIKSMQKYLLGGLRDTSVVGKYSMMHDNSIYQRGYSNPRTIKLAYKFCRVLDGPKTGWKIKPNTLSSDLQAYGHARGPHWKSQAKDKKSVVTFDTSNSSALQRGPPSEFLKGYFIMDVLFSASKQECDRLLHEMDEVFSPLVNVADPDLLAPWQRATEHAERKSSLINIPDVLKTIRKRQVLDLSKIASHVQNIYKQHQSKMKSHPGSGEVAFSKLAIENRQDVLRQLSKEFSSGPPLEELEFVEDETQLARLRASYAYTYDWEQSLEKVNSGKCSRFPWNNAMRELCAIKAAALGPHKTVIQGFYERFRIAGMRRR